MVVAGTIEMVVGTINVLHRGDTITAIQADDPATTRVVIVSTIIHPIHVNHLDQLIQIIQAVGATLINRLDLAFIKVT